MERERSGGGSAYSDSEDEGEEERRRGEGRMLFELPSSSLEQGDLILEIMNVHHGLQASNPVSRLRFFKHSDFDKTIAREVSEDKFKTILPSGFQYKALRVFCRDPAKESLGRLALEAWRKKQNSDI